MRLKNSQFGKACLIIGITAFTLYITIGQILILLGIANNNSLKISTLETLGTLTLYIPTIIALIAIVLGIAGLRIKNKSKEYAIIGMCFAAVPLAMNGFALIIALYAFMSQ